MYILILVVWEPVTVLYKVGELKAKPTKPQLLDNFYSSQIQDPLNCYLHRHQILQNRE